MTPTPEMLSSTPFRYAIDVRDGNIVTGKRIRQAVARFWRWVDEAPESGYYLDHSAGMHIVKFFPNYINHTAGKLAGKPFFLAPFQAFTLYNVFGWKKMAGDVPDPKNDVRRITKVYDKRAKKNGKSAEMAGLALYMMSFDFEMEAQVYVGATKEEQARICWKQARNFVDSPVANPKLRKMGFYTQQKIVGFKRTGSVMMPLGGDSTTQDGINTHLGIVDEYHAHKDDSVKENMESSMVLRSQPILWHITTAGTNLQSACKRYEDDMVDVLEGNMPAELSDHMFIMIHDMDEGDDWEDSANWFKANPLLGQGLEMDALEKRYNEVKLSRSKIPEFKTKSLNMWVDAPTVWILREEWMANKHDLTVEEVRQKFVLFGGYIGVDLSSNADLSAVVAVSEPDDDGDRYVVPFIFCPEDTIDAQGRTDKVSYRFWRDEGHIIATPGNQIDYDIIEEKILEIYKPYNIRRVEADRYQFEQMGQNLMKQNLNVSYFVQTIPVLNAPTRAFERLALSGNLRHDGNPVMAWNLASCRVIYDANMNMKVHKGKSNVDGRRIDSIPALINALGGSMSPEEESNESVYNNPGTEFVC